MIQIELHPSQRQVYDDQHRFRIVAAGRRWGKTVLSQIITLDWATRKGQEGLYWIVSPTYRQAKQIHWRHLQALVPQEWILKKNEVELSITLKNGSIIELKGAENPDALRGVKLRGLVIDEIASIRNWDWLWSEVLLPTLTDYGAPALFISTPKGFNHFYELYEMDKKSEGAYKSYRFTSYDNPFIKKEEIDKVKHEQTEDTFAQEYLADFRKATGVALREWEHEINLIPAFDIPSEWQRGRGFDYGSAHPTASVRVAVDGDDNWFVERAYNQSAMTIKDHADTIKSQDYGFGFIPAWGDPSGAQWFTEFSQHGLNIQPANKEIGQNARGWVEHCIEKLNERLKPVMGHTVRAGGRVVENAPRLFVLDVPENEPLVRQIENLKWRMNKSSDEVVPMLDESDDPTRGHYDLVAALRYFAVSYQKQRQKQWEPNDPGGVKSYLEGLLA